MRQQQSFLMMSFHQTKGRIRPYAVALHAMHYDFCRAQKTQREMPAMEGGIADDMGTSEEMLDTVGL